MYMHVYLYKSIDCPKIFTPQPPPRLALFMTLVRASPHFVFFQRISFLFLSPFRSFSIVQDSIEQTE